MSLAHLNRDELLGLLETVLTRGEDEERRTRSNLAEKDRMLTELELHQVELEVQNGELRRAQRALEESRNRYADLYDFAPIGYYSLDESGVIRELNLTGAALLGRARDDQREWTARLDRVLGTDTVLAVPATPVPATVIGDREGPALSRVMTRFTSPFNLAGVPVAR